MNELDILHLLSLDGTDDGPTELAGIVVRLVDGLIVRGTDGWSITETGRAVLEKQELAAH